MIKSTPFEYSCKNNRNLYQQIRLFGHFGVLMMMVMVMMTKMIMMILQGATQVFITTCPFGRVKYKFN